MSWTGVITDLGAQMIQQVIGGASLTFTAAQTGTGTTVDMEGATSVASQIGTGSMTSVTESDGVRIKIRIPALPGTSGYTMKQVGLFARIGENTPQLFALLQDSTGVSIPAANDFPDFVYNMSTFVPVSNTANISVTVDTTAIVSMSDLMALMENVVTVMRKFYASASSVGCPCVSGNNKAFIVYSSGSAGAMGGIMNAAYGALIFVSNGSYAVIHKGTNITISLQNGTLVVSSTSSVAMGVIEL